MGFGVTHLIRFELQTSSRDFPVLLGKLQYVSKYLSPDYFILLVDFKKVVANKVLNKNYRCC